MRKVFQQIEQVAPSDMSVLIVGESGCGKELAAQQIHNMSLRSAGPFVPLNCGALPPSLIEAELFGYEKGAFTGASRSHQGFFERAAGGTLFLDEITEMPLEMQVRLLRVLESGRLVRVGGTREVACQVRVLAATNRDPLEAVRANQLREDLLYRLAVFPLTLPPLRERGTDVLLLAKHFLAELNRQYGTAKRLSDRAAETLCQHDWPGNVRELKNCIQRAYVLTTDSEALDIDTVIPLGRCERLPGQGRLEFKVGVSLADAEQQIIFATLDHYEGNKRKAAEVLGVSLKTLYNRLNEYHRAGTLPERFAIGTGTRLG
jgi:DNA-binding NtrC family response regulator